MGSGLPLHVPRYWSHCHSAVFRDCKVPLFKTVSGAISSELALSLALLFYLYNVELGDKKVGSLRSTDVLPAYQLC